MKTNVMRGTSLWQGYPQVTEEHATAWLRLHDPVWQCSPLGTVTAANLMALWLWRAVHSDTNEVRPQVLLGVSFFALASDMDRIPVVLNQDFYREMSWEAKRLVQQLGRAGRKAVAAFEEAIKRDLGLREIYDAVVVDEGHRSSRKRAGIPLSLAMDSGQSSALQLVLKVAVIRGDGQEKGIIVRARPSGESIQIIKQEYMAIARKYATIPYVYVHSEGGETEIKEQQPEHTHDWDPKEEARRRRLHTVMFDAEDDYVRFTDYVYDQFGGLGLELTNVPITTSLRVRTWLLERTQGLFPMRPVTPEDIAKAAERVKGHRPFDPETIRGLHVPGVRRHQEPS